MVPKVRTPPSPPHSLQCREIRLDSSKKCRKSAEFRDSCSETGLGKVSSSMPRRGFCGLLSGGHLSSPVSKTPFGELECDHNTMMRRSGLDFASVGSIAMEMAKAP